MSASAISSVTRSKSQSSCRLDLLPAQRPCDRDVSIRDFLRHTIVVGQMYHFELRKIATQPLGEPCRDLPQFEAVMESDEELHEDSFELRVSSFKWKKEKTFAPEDETGKRH